MHHFACPMTVAQAGGGKVRRVSGGETVSVAPSKVYVASDVMSDSVQGFEHATRSEGQWSLETHSVGYDGKCDLAVMHVVIVRRRTRGASAMSL